MFGVYANLLAYICNRLNSTLSVRIEELNNQIATLQVENLRLRASSIALGAQLKREREKSRRVMADAETAVSTVVSYSDLFKCSSRRKHSCIRRYTTSSSTLAISESHTTSHIPLLYPPRNLLHPLKPVVHSRTQIHHL